MSGVQGRCKFLKNLQVGKNLYSKNCRATIYQAFSQTGLPFVKIKDLKPEMANHCHFSASLRLGTAKSSIGRFRGKNSANSFL